MYLTGIEYTTNRAVYCLTRTGRYTHMLRLHARRLPKLKADLGHLDHARTKHVCVRFRRSETPPLISDRGCGRSYGVHRAHPAAGEQSTVPSSSTATAHRCSACRRSHSLSISLSLYLSLSLSLSLFLSLFLSPSRSREDIRVAVRVRSSHVSDRKCDDSRSGAKLPTSARAGALKPAEPADAYCARADNSVLRTCTKPQRSMLFSSRVVYRPCDRAMEYRAVGTAGALRIDTGHVLEPERCSSH